MTFAEARLAFTPHSADVEVRHVDAPAGWAAGFEVVSGDMAQVASLSPERRVAELFIAFVILVFRDRVDAAAAFREFCKIDDFVNYLPEELRAPVNGTTVH